jgi:hypothetical protein
MHRFAALICFAALAQDPTFRSTTSLVRIDAEAILPNGQVVTGLKAADFRVLDEGQPQTIANFAFEEDPLDLILLFDDSSGMKGKIQSVIRAAELGFHELRQGDRVSVMAYNINTRVAQGFTPNLEAVNEAILLKVLAAPFSGSSQIETAASEAAMRFRGEPTSHRKRAILAVTDKGEGGAATDIRELWSGNIVFSELLVGKGGATRVMDSGPASTTARTGGVVIAAGVPGEAFQQSVHFLRSGYTLYYSQPEAQAGAERSVKVELTAEAAKRFAGAKVRARSGYLVPGR